jgi:hypothetical protein
MAFLPYRESLVILFDNRTYVRITNLTATIAARQSRRQTISGVGEPAAG